MNAENADAPAVTEARRNLKPGKERDNIGNVTPLVHLAQGVLTAARAIRRECRFCLGGAYYGATQAACISKIASKQGAERLKRLKNRRSEATPPLTPTKTRSAVVDAENTSNDGRPS